jgi:hypothetical protein
MIGERIIELEELYDHSTSEDRGRKLHMTFSALAQACAQAGCVAF